MFFNKLRFNQRLVRNRVTAKAVLQYEGSECGAASLSIILGYFGRYVPLKDLREACGIDRDGSNAQQILRAARQYDLEANPLKYTPEQLRDQGLFPCIVFWRFNHFLVVEGFDGEHAYLSDPGEGRVRISFKEFANSFTGLAIQLQPTSDFRPGGSSPKSPLVLGFEILKPYRQESLKLLFLSLLSIVPLLITAGCSSQFIDQFLQNDRTYFGLPIIWILFASIVILLGLTFGSYIVLRRVEYLLSKEMASVLFYNLYKSEFKYVLTRIIAELATRMDLSIKTPEYLVAQILRYLISLIQASAILLFSFFISIPLALLAFILIALNIYMNAWLTDLRQDANRKLSLEQGKTIGTGLQGINNIETLKACGLEFDFLGQWQTHFSSVVDLRQKLGYQMAFSTVASKGSEFALQVLTIGLGGLLIISGNLTLGNLVAFQFIVTLAVQPLTQVSIISKFVQELEGMLGRMDDVFNAEQDDYVRSLDISTHSNEDNEVKKLTGSIRLLDLTFGFNNVDPPLFDEICMTIEPGEHLSIVGKSGSGKSTLLKLIAGLYKPLSGEITFDEKNWLDYSDQTIRNSLAYVPQDYFMFNETIRNNLSLWDSSITDEQIFEAASQAEALKIILGHPDALKRNLADNGKDLSGGERQRLEICRALVRNPSIVILDEATSALDNETEKLVLEHLINSGKTIISVAHRLASAFMSDKVLVLDHGVPIEYGSPDDLLKKDTVFAKFASLEVS